MAKLPATTQLLKMHQLPKAEYALLKKIIDKYHFENPEWSGAKVMSEVFTVCLRLAYEVSKMKDAHIANGERYFLQVLEGYRTNPAEERVYEL